MKMKTAKDWQACYPEIDVFWIKRIVAETLIESARIALESDNKDAAVRKLLTASLDYMVKE